MIASFSGLVPGSRHLGPLRAACAAILMLSVSSHAAGPPLVAGEPVLVPDSKGGFDYLQVDESRRRLLANHTGNNTLDVFDLGSGHLIKQVRTGKAQGVAVVPEAGKYFVSVSREEVVVVIDSETLEQTGTIKLGGPGDAIAFDPKHHCLYVGHDDGPHLWVIDTRTEKLTVTVDIPEGPEWVLYDPSTDRVFQNIKSNDSLLVIDPATHTIQARWTTAPARNPHGLALDPKTHRLFCAGTNGKLAVLDSFTGRVLAAVDIAPGVDQIVFDPELHRIYCASGKGVISVVEEAGEAVVFVGEIKTKPGAKTIALDSKTHAVWVAYADKEHSYVLRLAP